MEVAEMTLLEALKLFSSEATIHFNLACYACQFGRIPEAKYDWEKPSQSIRRTNCWLLKPRIWYRCGRTESHIAIDLRKKRNRVGGLLHQPGYSLTIPAESLTSERSWY